MTCGPGYDPPHRGSIGTNSRPAEVLIASRSHGTCQITDAAFVTAQEHAGGNTIRRLEEIETPVVTDGERSKPSFAIYPGARRLVPVGGQGAEPRS